MSRTGGNVQMSAKDWRGSGMRPSAANSTIVAIRRSSLRSISRFVTLVAFLITVGMSARVYAQGVDVVADRPAATLLLPYFQVNLTASKNAATTLFSIVN